MPNEIKQEMVPNESILAVIKRFPSFFRNHDEVEAVIATALSAWPGMFRTEMEEAAGVRRRIILPLTQTQEDGDGK